MTSALVGSHSSLPAVLWKWLSRLESLCWGLFFLFLPVTSFPFFPPALGGGALVRPLSIYPLLVLVIIATLPRLLTQRLPKSFISLAPFVLVAVASSLLSLLRGISPALGVTVGDRILRALITLGIGLAMYCTVALLPRTTASLRAALRWMYAGFSVALLWGSLQAVYMLNFTPAYFQLLNKIQAYISTRRLFNNRVSGMTYEPNWFGEQLTFLLMPWLLGAVLTGTSSFRWRWKWVTVEWLLLGWTVAVLAFTVSRAGFMNLFALAVASVLFFRPRHHLRSPLAGDPAPLAGTRSAGTHRRWRTWALRSAEALLAVALLAGGLYAVGSRNAFFARIWDYWRTAKQPSLTGYFEYLGFNARFIYSEAAFNTYREYPVFGVGLGNYAFYFEQMLPDRPLTSTPEVLRIITPDAGRDRLITAKNFYFRLLAETGLVGMAAFMAFLAAVLGGALWLWLDARREVRCLGNRRPVRRADFLPGRAVLRFLCPTQYVGGLWPGHSLRPPLFPAYTLTVHPNFSFSYSLLSLLNSRFPVLSMKNSTIVTLLGIAALLCLLCTICAAVSLAASSLWLQSRPEGEQSLLGGSPGSALATPELLRPTLQPSAAASQTPGLATPPTPAPSAVDPLPASPQATQADPTAVPPNPDETLLTLRDTKIPVADLADIMRRLKGISGIPPTLEPPAETARRGDQQKFWLSNEDRGALLPGRRHAALCDRCGLLLGGRWGALRAEQPGAPGQHL